MTKQFESYISKNLGIFIKEKRANTGLTQEQVALLSNVSRQTVNTIEKNGCNISIGTVYNIFNAIGTSFSEFVSFLEANRPLEILKRLDISKEDKEKISEVIISELE